MSSDPIRIFQDAMGRLLKDIGEEDQWFFSLPTHHSVFRLDHISITSFELYGKGRWDSPETIVKIRLNYRLNQAGRRRRYRWVCKGLPDTIKFLLNLRREREVCLECGDIHRKGEKCDPCEFFRALRKAEGSEVDCAICMEKVYRTMLGCGHSFHMTCLSKLELGSLRCPVCRVELTKEEMEEFFFGEEDDSDDESDDDDYNGS